MIHQAPVLLLILPLAGSLLVFLSALGPAFFSRALALLILLAGIILSLVLPLSVSGDWHYNLGGWAPPWGIETRLSAFTGLLAAAVYFLSFLALASLGSDARKEQTPSQGILDGFWLLLTGSLTGLLLVRDAFTIYLLLELSVLAAGMLLAGGGKRTWLAAFRFIFGGSVGASLYLLGIAYLYAATGTLHLDDLLAQLLISKNFHLIWAAGFFLTAGFVLPLLFPLPALFSGFLGELSPGFLVFLVPVAARVAFFLLFVFYFFVLGIPGLTTPFWLAAAEQLTAALFLSGFWFAVREGETDRAAAFLGAAPLGYVLAGFMLGTSGALTGALLEILNQLLALAGLYLIFLWAGESTGTREAGRWAGAGRKKPLMAAAFLLLAADLAGLPPTGGFYAKLYIFKAAFDQRQWFLALVLAAGYGLSLYYLVRAACGLFFPSKDSRAKAAPLYFKKTAPQFSWSVAALVLAVLALGIFHRTLVKNVIAPALPKAFQNLNLPVEPFSNQQVE